MKYSVSGMKTWKFSNVRAGLMLLAWTHSWACNAIRAQGVYGMQNSWNFSNFIHMKICTCTRKASPGRTTPLDARIARWSKKQQIVQSAHFPRRGWMFTICFGVHFRYWKLLLVIRFEPWSGRYLLLAEVARRSNSSELSTMPGHARQDQGPKVHTCKFHGDI